MAVDYDRKLEEIHNDYYSALGKFANIEKLIISKDYDIKPGDNDLTKKIKEAQLNEILVDLGRVGEMAFKYLIKLEQLNSYPNQPLEQFQKDALFKKGPLKSYADKKHVSDSDIEPLLDYEDINNQPLHNFDYLFLFIEKLMPTLAEKFYKVIEYRLTSKMIKEMPGFNIVDNEYVVFPEETYYTIIDEKTDEEKKQKLKDLRRDTIKQSGDIFTRLRYFANNPHDKSFNVQDIYELMKDVIFFIEMVHLCDDKLDINIEMAYAKAMLKSDPSLVDRPENEVWEIMNIPKIKDTPRAVADLLYYSKGFTLDQIKAIASDDRIDPVEYVEVLCNGLSQEVIDYFFSQGINDYDDMVAIMVPRGPKNLKILLNTQKYTLDQIKRIAEIIEHKKYNNIILLKYLSYKTIKKLNDYPEIREILLNNEGLFEVLPGAMPFGIAEKFLLDMISTEEVQKNPNLIFSADEDQVTIYSEISNYLLRSSPVYEQTINKSNFFPGMWIEHLRENCELFKDYPNVLSNIPIFLDGDDNKKILDLLIENGFNINNFETLDTTIFCMPYILVQTVIKTLQTAGVPVITSNNINPLYFDYVENILNNLRGTQKDKYKTYNYLGKRKTITKRVHEGPIYRRERG